MIAQFLVPVSLRKKAQISGEKVQKESVNVTNVLKSLVRGSKGQIFSCVRPNVCDVLS